MSFEKLHPVANTILFTFLDETGGAAGAFVERTKSMIIVPKLNSTQKQERWARAERVGPDVHEVEPGDLILIEPLQWTRNEVFEGQKIWKTDESKVMAVTNDETLTIAF